MADWTIMVYISADNVLANFAIESLKQLRDAAGDRIVVIAQFDDNQQKDARIYRFDGGPGKQDKSIESSEVLQDKLGKLKKTIRKVNMTNPQSLTQFIDYATEESKTDHYCLILWGHGIELLLDDQRRFGATKKPVRRYLSIGNLKKALQDTTLAKGQLDRNHPKTILDTKRSQNARSSEEIKSNLRMMRAKNPKSTFGSLRTNEERRHALDIIGIDACSMSMIEVASELQGHVDFMVASQEDVPDMSFPYEKILKGLEEIRAKETKDKEIRVRKVCKEIPKLYAQVFRDYIATPDTGVKGITLASVDLGKIRTIAQPLKKLATALLAASTVPSLRKRVLSARKEAKDFVFGLLVDLCDFCHCLESELTRAHLNDVDLLPVCKEICRLLEVRDEGIVIENQSDDKKHRCHGLSIYLPYRDDDATDDAEEWFAKGGGRQPLKGGGRQPLKERTARIRELEADFARLNQFQQSGWGEFIRRGWSLILAKETPFKLDRYYSAEQVARNLVSWKKPSDVKPHAPRVQEDAGEDAA